MRNFISECKKKNFHKQTAMALGTIAGSKQALLVYGDTESSFRALTTLVTQYNDEQTVINEFMKTVKE